MTHPPDMPGTEDQTLRALVGFWADSGVLDPDEARALAALTTAPAPRAAAPAVRNPLPVEAEAARTRPRPAPKALVRNPAAQARELAAGATSIPQLKAAIEGFKGCPLHEAARNTVVFDGVTGAPVMLVGEAPGEEEDHQGLPFVGRSGKLQDRMLATIGLSRTSNLYITNLIYWRPPKNRNPEQEEIEVCAPFLTRQIELVRPRLILTAGRFAAQAMLGTEDGIMKLRGRRHTLAREHLPPVPCLPLLHPSYLLRRPADKAKAWADMLALAALCDELGVKREGAL
jgi:uracil-DNA glycosylase family 4